jgi:hypothetical protein
VITQWPGGTSPIAAAVSCPVCILVAAQPVLLPPTLSSAEAVLRRTAEARCSCSCCMITARSWALPNTEHPPLSSPATRLPPSPPISPLPQLPHLCPTSLPGSICRACCCHRCRSFISSLEPAPSPPPLRMHALTTACPRHPSHTSSSFAASRVALLPLLLLPPLPLPLLHHAFDWDYRFDVSCCVSLLQHMR